MRVLVCVIAISSFVAVAAPAQPARSKPPEQTLVTSPGLLAGNAESQFSSNLDWAQVRFVEATETGDTVWRFSVTVEHNDQGWDHYADLWQVVDPDTLEVYGERVLLHPHDTEQPFRRSQSGIEIPPGVEAVLVRARCNEHDWSGQAVLVPLVPAEDEYFSVSRR
jgi:hypothetical protein